MPYTDRINLVIPDGQKANANDTWAVLDPDSGGTKTFSVPLSASGTNPQTHWGTRTPLEQATYDALTTMTSPQFKTYVDGLAAQRSRATVGAVGFKNSLSLDATMGFYEYIAVLGLQRINPPSI